MKRAMRFLRHAAIAGSALVCVAAVADRVWDCWAGHYFTALTRWTTGERTSTVGPTFLSHKGVVSISLGRNDFRTAEFQMVGRSGLFYATLPPAIHMSEAGDTLLKRSGFAAFVFDPGPRNFFRPRAWTVEVPHWFIATLTAIAPACWLTGHLRRRRDRDAGRCRRCGYDLRATPDRCPECGDPHAATGTDSRRVGFSPRVARGSRADVG